LSLKLHPTLEVRMRKFFLLSAVLMLFSCLAIAQTGLNLYRNDCGQASSNRSVTIACVLCSGTAFVAFSSVILPADTLRSFVGITSTIDIQSPTSSLPDWWSSRCNPNNIAFATDAAGSCPMLWDNGPIPYAWVTRYPGVGGANRERIVISALLDSTMAYDLGGDGQTELSVYRFLVIKNRILTCAGCAAPVCLTLNEVCFHSLASDATAFLRITAPITNNTITVNDPTACAGATPVRNRTWGTLKGLYR
jgi:hypothetical protein